MAARLPGGRSSEQPEAVVEPRPDLLRRQDSDPGGGQFYGQGDAIEPGADLRHGGGVVVGDGEVGPGLPGPLPE